VDAAARDQEAFRTRPRPPNRTAEKAGEELKELGSKAVEEAKIWAKAEHSAKAGDKTGEAEKAGTRPLTPGTRCPPPPDDMVKGALMADGMTRRTSTWLRMPHRTQCSSRDVPHAAGAAGAHRAVRFAGLPVRNAQVAKAEG
jgi:hypothetical protein